MEAFFVSIILIGILIVCFALIWMVIEKKRTLDYRLEIDERRYELKHIIEDADQLLTEMNNFSSYIVNQMEEKQKSVENTLRQADESIDCLYQNMYMASAQAPQAFRIEMEQQEQIKENIGNIKTEAIQEIEETDESIIISRIKGKLIPFNERKREVIKLHKKGINSIEIAKMLDMGKGEIELISRMCQ